MKDYFIDILENRTMNAIEYLKLNHTKDTVISKGIVIAKYCILDNNHKHGAIIPCNLLNIVYSGTKIIHTSEGDIKINAGEGFFITKGEYVMSEVIGDEEYSCLLIFFDDILSAKLFSELTFKNANNNLYENKNFLKIKLNPFIKNSADAILLFLKDRPLFTDELLMLKLKELMLLLLGSDYKESFIRLFKSSISNKVDLKSFMEDNFDKELTIEELAKLSGRSLSAFKREFRLVFNEAPMRWIHKKRLLRGKFLIEKLGFDIGLTARSVGFKTHSHFSRLYKEMFGIPPSLSNKK